MTVPKVRILVADDFKPWRDEVRRMLQVQPGWQVIDEARDGVEAVQISADTHPDVVLLDIGMPNMNGIEAAKRIAQVSPTSKIIFVTENADSDIMRAALATGAKAYLVKTKAARELVAAIAAALGQLSLIIGYAVLRSIASP